MNDPVDPGTAYQAPTDDTEDTEESCPAIGETSSELGIDSLDKSDTPPDWSIPPKM
jgi:hypothetical protein